jgi:VanZ family protein
VAISRVTLYVALIGILSGVFLRDVFNFFVAAFGRDGVRSLIWVPFVLAACALPALAKRIELRRLVLLAVLLSVGIIFAAQLSIAEERVHLIKYGLISALAASDIARYQPAARARHVALGAFLFSLVVSCLDEALQSVTPGRVGDPRDIGFDSIGAVWGTSLFLAARRSLHSGSNAVLSKLNDVRST